MTILKHRVATWVCVHFSRLLSTSDTPCVVTSFWLWRHWVMGAQIVGLRFDLRSSISSEIWKISFVLFEDVNYAHYIRCHDLVMRCSKYMTHRTREFSLRVQMAWFQSLKWGMYFSVKWILGKVRIFCELFPQIDSFWLEGLKCVNPTAFFVLTSFGRSVSWAFY